MYRRYHMDTRTLSYQGIGCQIQIMGTGYLDAKSAPNTKETGSMISQVFLAHNYSSFFARLSENFQSVILMYVSY